MLLVCLGSICLVSEPEKAPTNHTKLAAYDAFIPTMDERCDWVAKCIHNMFVDMEKKLTHVCYHEYENEDHNDIDFE